MFKWIQKGIKKVYRAVRPLSPLQLLEQKMIDLKETDLRTAAEYAYALAMIYKRKGNTAKAIDFGLESIALFDRSKLRTEWDSARRNEVIGGIKLPEIIHQGIVREHLKPLELKHPPKKES